MTCSILVTGKKCCFVLSVSLCTIYCFVQGTFSLTLGPGPLASLEVKVTVICEKFWIRREGSYPIACFAVSFHCQCVGDGEQGVVDLDETVFCPLSHQTIGHQCNLLSFVHCSLCLKQAETSCLDSIPAHRSFLRHKWHSADTIFQKSDFLHQEADILNCL